MSAATLDVPAVAALLSMSVPAFRRRRPRLQREAGFPRTLPCAGAVWSRAQVEAWVAAGGVAAAIAAPAPAAVAPDPVAADRALLEERYVGGAA